MKPAMWGALVGVLGLTVWLASQDSAEVEPVARTERPARGAHAPEPSDPGEGRQRPARTATRATPTSAASSEPDEAQRSLSLGVQAWQRRLAAAAEPASRPHSGAASPWASMAPPPPPPPKPVAPPPPQAPRFPYAWLGRFNDEPGAERAVQRAVIEGPQRTWVVGTGEVIDGQWRVDQIQERSLRLTYLPLQQAQTVAMR